MNRQYGRASAGTLRQLFDDAVERGGARPLLIDDRDGGILSYGDAGALVRSLARRLLEDGLCPGDVALVCAPTHAEAVLFFWAATYVGLVVSPVDYASPAPALRHFVRQLEPKIALCERARLPVLREAYRGPVLVLDDERSDGVAPPAVLFSEWMGELSDGPDSLPAVEPGDTAVVMFTSGTTGLPRGAALGQRALCHSGAVVAEAFDWREEDVLLALGDLDGASGLRNPCVASLCAGCAVLVVPPARRGNVYAVVERICEHRCTLLSTTPTLIRQLATWSDRFDAADLTTLRQIVSVASALGGETTARIHELFGIPVLNTWGMTETTGICIAVPHDRARPGQDTIGIPVGCTAEVVDERGARVPRGELGELRVAGETLMTGYWRDPEATARSVRDGWLYTGDLVREGPDGWLTIAGRRVEFVKTALGQRVHPAEVEAALELHEAVVEAGACGFLSPYGDEQLAGFAVPAAPPEHPERLLEELRRFLVAELGPHRAPQVLRLIDAIPRNKTGKIRRGALAERLSQE